MGVAKIQIDWTEEAITKLIELVDAGYTYNEISFETGYSKKQIKYQLSKLGLDVKNKQSRYIWDRKVEDDIIDHYKRQYPDITVKELSLIYNIPYRSMISMFNRRNIDVSPLIFWTDVRIKQLYDLHVVRDVPLCDIADSFNKSKSYIMHQLTKMGIFSEKYKKITENRILADSNKKRCGKCSVIKDFGEYYISSDRNTTVSICIECARKVSKERSAELRRPNLVLYSKKKIGECKRRARIYNYAFDLTLESVLEMFEKQNGCCFYTGIPMKDHSNDIYSMSIDRINSEKGYTQDNVVLCGYKFNMMKNDLSIKQMYEMVECVYNRKDEVFKILEQS
jgi:hypothetical protein